MKLSTSDNPIKSDPEPPPVPPVRVTYSKQELSAKLEEWMIKEFGHPMDYVSEPEQQDRWYRDNGVLYRFVCSLFPPPPEPRKEPAP